MTSLRDRVAGRVGEVWPGGELASFDNLPGGHSGITCLATITLPGGGQERGGRQGDATGTKPGRPT